MAGSSLLSQKWYLSRKILSLVSAFFIAVALMQSSNGSASAMANSYTFGNGQPLDQASVSVVRLLASYTATTPGCTSTVTGLGVFVGSWLATAGSSDFINILMTIY